MQTLSRVIQRRTRRHLSVVDRLAPTSWVNDEEFEILESGILGDESDANRSDQRAVRY